ncbi:IclR family transcriptional regulator [Marinicrinis lubricantis]|uniref:IclR family transcriptional regulator n=1 Tax=Marinicrinis lubricantis TaxID=2086470 RepID=A0ABW1IL01_9BACL
MERKYWVPALERADMVLRQIAEHPSMLKMTDLCHVTGIHKSTMFSLLHTLESLSWIKRDKGDTYALGAIFGTLGNAYFSNNDLIDRFMELAEEGLQEIGETLQLSKLEGGDIIYLAKKESISPVRLISEPGTRIPAYAAAMGKVMLADLKEEQLRSLYKDESFLQLTPNTITSLAQLEQSLNTVRKQGYALDQEEVAEGFSCVAAPVKNTEGKVIAAVSFSMLTGRWMKKKEQAIKAIQNIAMQLSLAE